MAFPGYLHLNVSCAGIRGIAPAVMLLVFANVCDCLFVFFFFFFFFFVCVFLFVCMCVLLLLLLFYCGFQEN